MNISNIGSQNFGAKLNLSEMDSYKSYWSNVAKEFAKNTKGIRGEMTLHSYKSYKSGVDLNLRTSKSHRGYALVSDCAFKEMTNEPAKKVGKKLAKFFKIACPVIDENADALSQMYNMLKGTKFSTHSMHNWEMLEDKYYTPVRNEINKKVDNQIKKESDLVGFEILI